MKKNNLPKYWAVYNDGSDEFKKVVLPVIKEVYGENMRGFNVGEFYGFDGEGLGIMIHKEILSFSHHPRKGLSIPEFARLSQPIDKKYVLKEEFKHCTNTVRIILEDEGFTEYDLFVENTIISGTHFEVTFKSLGLLDLWFKEYEPIKPPKIGGVEPLIRHKTISYGDTTFTFREIKRGWGYVKKIDELNEKNSDFITIVELKQIYDFVMEEEGTK